MDHRLGDVARAASLLGPVSGPAHPFLELRPFPGLGARVGGHRPRRPLGHEVDLVAVKRGGAGGGDRLLDPGHEAVTLLDLHEGLVDLLHLGDEAAARVDDEDDDLALAVLVRLLGDPPHLVVAELDPHHFRQRQHEDPGLIGRGLGGLRRAGRPLVGCPGELEVRFRLRAPHGLDLQEVALEDGLAAHLPRQLALDREVVLPRLHEAAFVGDLDAPLEDGQLDVIGHVAPPPGPVLEPKLHRVTGGGHHRDRENDGACENVSKKVFHGHERLVNDLYSNSLNVIRLRRPRSHPNPVLTS